MDNNKEINSSNNNFFYKFINFVYKLGVAMFRNLKEEIQKFCKVIQTDLWSTELVEYSFFSRIFLMMYRLMYFIFVDFARKKTLMMASALSYATVLGIVPIMLVIVALSKGLLEEKLMMNAPRFINFLVEKLVPVINALPNHGGGIQLHQTLQDYINQQLIPTITRLDFQQIGLYGAILLIVISFSLMNTVEKAFNDIWGVTLKRSLWKLILHYWLVIALFPAIILLVFWITGFAIFHYAINIGQSKLFSGIASQQMVTFLILWAVFAFVYKIIPNINVKVIPAILGGVVGGTLWHLNNLLSFIFVSSTLRTHYLYGGLGIIPIFLVALFIGWLIVLLGAHIAYAVQNIEFFRVKLLATDIQPSDTQEIAVICVAIIAMSFINKRQPPTAEELSKLSGLPFAYFSGPLAVLKNRNFIRKTNDDPARYILGLSPESLCLKDIMDSAIGHQNDRQLPLVSNKRLWKETIRVCNNYRNSYTLEANPTLLRLVKELNLES